MSDYLVKETLDFAEKIFFALTQTDTRLAAAKLAMHRGMFFLHADLITAAIRLLKSREGSAQESRDALRDFVLIIRREVGAVAIDEEGVNRLLRSTLELAETKREGNSE